MIYEGGLDGDGLLNSAAWGQCGGVLKVVPVFILRFNSLFAASSLVFFL